jgi:hypothetical protein
MKGNQMSDMNFEAMLAEHNQNYRDTEEFSDWMPDEGEYTVSVQKCSKGVSEKDGMKMGWWKLTARIEAGDNIDKVLGNEFALGFYNTKAMGILKGQARALNGGEAVESINEADQVFENAVGNVLRVKVSTTTSKKNGQEYTNCYVQEVIPTTEEIDNAEPPQEEGDALPQA